MGSRAESIKVVAAWVVSPSNDMRAETRSNQLIGAGPQGGYIKGAAGPQTMSKMDGWRCALACLPALTILAVFF